MKLKKIVAAVLGIFVILSLGTFVYKNSTTPKVEIEVKHSQVEANHAQEKSDNHATANKRIDATYFHGTQRCYTCTLMEKYIREVLNDKYSSELENGQLNFKTINVGEPANDHYIQDYSLYTKSFILSLKNKGKEEKWFNCDKIWNLVRNETMFKNYIKTEVDKYLGML